MSSRNVKEEWVDFTLNTSSLTKKISIIESHYFQRLKIMQIDV